MNKRIALLIDYNIHFARSVADGVARFVQTVGDWRFYTQDGVPSIRLQALQNWQGDGVIGFLTPPAQALLEKRSIPYVNVKSDYPELAATSVLVDNEASGRLAAEYLLSKGFQRFAFSALSIKGASGELKGKGFRERLAEAGYTCHPLSSKKQLANLQVLYNGETGSSSLPLAVFAAEDHLARQIIECCRDQGLRVPEQVSVLGHNNNPFICSMLVPQLSSIELGAERIGFAAAKLLNRLMAGEASPSSALLIAPERIVERRSTELIAVEQPAVAAALDYIRSHDREAITVGDVVEAVPVGRRRLEKLFQEELERTIHDEIRRTRILRAEALLRETDMLVATIAHSCGYSSRERFNAAFRQETGTTPSAYRTQYRFAKHP